MAAFINKDDETIISKLNLIIQQNDNIQKRLEEIITALLKNDNEKICNKAVKDFLDNYLNNYP